MIVRSGVNADELTAILSATQIACCRAFASVAALIQLPPRASRGSTHTYLQPLRGSVVVDTLELEYPGDLSQFSELWSEPVGGRSKQWHRERRLHTRQPATCTLTGHCKYKSMDERSEEHKSELQQLMSKSYAALCLKKKKQ